MGMDVVGRNNPEAYFRNNVWYWRPLWNYCVEVAPELCDGVEGHYNDGNGLDEEEALALAKVLNEELWSGRTRRYELAYNESMASLPRHDCGHCEGTGIRKDEIGLEMSMPTRELEPHVAIIVGRTHGWCNACGGEGTVEHFETNYPFTVENVAEFVSFLELCGGFSIY
jgi:hypothetical protein